MCSVAGRCSASHDGERRHQDCGHPAEAAHGGPVGGPARRPAGDQVRPGRPTGTVCSERRKVEINKIPISQKLTFEWRRPKPEQQYSPAPREGAQPA